MSSPIIIPNGNLILQDSKGNVTLVSCADTLGLLNDMITSLKTTTEGASDLATRDVAQVNVVLESIGAKISTLS